MAGIGGDGLVSVGVPTYNRVGTLRRAVESILAQDYPHIEVVISDNASTDGTQAWCEEVARRDTRVHYLRQPVNIGLVANYREVFLRSHGEFYVAFADDDWLEPTYVSHCLRALREGPELVLVSAKWRMFRGEEFLHEGVTFDLLQETGRERVLAYYKHVDKNETFHGVARRTLLETIPPMRHPIGDDWFYMASVAYKGKARILHSTAINKDAGGGSAGWEERIEGYPWYIYLPLFAARDILWASPVYATSPPWDRLVLAIEVLFLLLWKVSGRPVPRPLRRALARGRYRHL